MTLKTNGTKQIKTQMKQNVDKGVKVLVGACCSYAVYAYAPIEWNPRS